MKLLEISRDVCLYYYISFFPDFDINSICKKIRANISSRIGLEKETNVYVRRALRVACDHRSVGNICILPTIILPLRFKENKPPGAPWTQEQYREAVSVEQVCWKNETN
jgi:hypothetical protein